MELEAHHELSPTVGAHKLSGCGGGQAPPGLTRYSALNPPTWPSVPGNSAGGSRRNNEPSNVVACHDASIETGPFTGSGGYPGLSVATTVNLPVPGATRTTC